MSCRSNSRAWLGKALRSLLLRRVIFSSSAVMSELTRMVCLAFNFYRQSVQSKITLSRLAVQPLFAQNLIWAPKNGLG